MELFHLRGHLERSLPIVGDSAHHPRPPDLHRSVHAIAEELAALKGLLAEGWERGVPRD